MAQTSPSSLLSTLFAHKETNEIAGNFFNDSAKSKFARKYKPEEFNITSTVKNEADDDGPEGALSSIEETKQARINEKKRKRHENRSNKMAKTNGGITSPHTQGSDDANTQIPVDDVNHGDTQSSTAISGSDKVGNDDDCTIFVGNIPISETIKTVTKFFKSYGEILSVRLRSVPVSGTKVDEAGNQNLVRKVCVNSKQFGEQKGSFNAYVRFRVAGSATNALQANNSLFGIRHIRVDRVHPTLFDPRRSIFLGNLPHYADEEEIREYFAASLAHGHDDIEGLRLIRDPDTLVGKGIGYLLLKDRDAVFKALQLDRAVFKKRWALRVSVCGKRTKRDHHDRDQHSIDDDSERASASSNDKGPSTNSGRKVNKPLIANRSSPIVGINASYAMKRIKMKSSSTRNQLLRERNQKHSSKSKRLGGVIKRAMKATKA